VAPPPGGGGGVGGGWEPDTGSALLNVEAAEPPGTGSHPPLGALQWHRVVKGGLGTTYACSAYKHWGRDGNDCFAATVLRMMPSGAKEASLCCLDAAGQRSVAGCCAAMLAHQTGSRGRLCMGCRLSLGRVGP